MGSGNRGPVTERLQKDFFSLLAGEAEDRYGWLTPIPVEDVPTDNVTVGRESP